MHFSSATPTGGTRRAGRAARPRSPPSPLPPGPGPGPAPALVLAAGGGARAPAREGPPARRWRALAFPPPDPEKEAAHPGAARPALLSFPRRATFTRASPPARPPKIPHPPQALLACPWEGSRENPPSPPLCSKPSPRSGSRCLSGHFSPPMTPASRTHAWSGPADSPESPFPPRRKRSLGALLRPALRLARQPPNLRLQVTQVPPSASAHPRCARQAPATGHTSRLDPLIHLPPAARAGGPRQRCTDPPAPSRPSPNPPPQSWPTLQANLPAPAAGPSLSSLLAAAARSRAEAGTSQGEKFPHALRRLSPPGAHVAPHLHPAAAAALLEARFSRCTGQPNNHAEIPTHPCLRRRSTAPPGAASVVFLS